MATNKYANVNLGTVEAVLNKLGGIEGAEAFLRDETKIVPKTVAVKKKQLITTSTSTHVHVDPSIKPRYPDKMKKVLHPEFEYTGEAGYELATNTTLWLHSRQCRGVVTGQLIYDFLKDERMLTYCGNLQDAEAVQKLGATVFQRIFGSTTTVYFWKSVVKHGVTKNLIVPCLFQNVNKVLLRWHGLEDDFGNNDPAFYFR